MHRDGGECPQPACSARAHHCGVGSDSSVIPMLGFDIKKVAWACLQWDTVLALSGKVASGLCAGRMHTHAHACAPPHPACGTQACAHPSYRHTISCHMRLTAIGISSHAQHASVWAHYGAQKSAMHAPCMMHVLWGMACVPAMEVDQHLRREGRHFMHALLRAFCMHAQWTGRICVALFCNN